MTQTRVNNIPLILLSYFQLQMIDWLELEACEGSISLILLQHFAYFAYGGSYAISSIDISNAYNGVSSYNVTAVGVLTFISNWAGPIWWSIGISTVMAKYFDDDWRPFTKQLCALTIFASASAASIMMACTLLRTHLFIWTVFSPKYLYCMAWTLGQHLLIDMSSNIVFKASW